MCSVRTALEHIRDVDPVPSIIRRAIIERTVYILLPYVVVGLFVKLFYFFFFTGFLKLLLQISCYTYNSYGGNGGTP